jgi:hypothetical protein
MAKKAQTKIRSKKDTADAMLDKALAASFPASDPVSLETTLIPGTHPVKKKPAGKARGRLAITTRKPAVKPKKKAAKRK